MYFIPSDICLFNNKQLTCPLSSHKHTVPIITVDILLYSPVHDENNRHCELGHETYC